MAAKFDTYACDIKLVRDMLPDGWEIQYGLNPCECATTNSPVWDADGDGLGLFDEYRYCTSPVTNDTDGDLVLDGVEVPHSPGSCPNDADDGGDPANCVKLRLTVGDPSGSESERWNMDVFEEATGRAVCHHCDDGFGTPGSAEYALAKGKAYAFSLRWVATNLDGAPITTGGRLSTTRPRRAGARGSTAPARSSSRVLTDCLIYHFNAVFEN